MKNWRRSSREFLDEAAIASIVFYQNTVACRGGIFSIWWGSARCRFYPLCSDYAIAAIRQYGLKQGGVASLKRICRCNPFFRGGYDPVSDFKMGAVFPSTPKA